MSQLCTYAVVKFRFMHKKTLVWLEIPVSVTMIMDVDGPTSHEKQLDMSAGVLTDVHCCDSYCSRPFGSLVGTHRRCE